MNDIIYFNSLEGDYGFLSNEYLSDFKFAEQEFSSMEQYIAYRKALIFEDVETASRVLKTSDIDEIKMLRKNVKNFSDNVWNMYKELVTIDGIYSKFLSNSELSKKMLSTGDAYFAFCSKNSLTWGIGLDLNDSRRFDKDNWIGKNLLGRLLYQTKGYIRAMR